MQPGSPTHRPTVEVIHVIHVTSAAGDWSRRRVNCGGKLERTDGEEAVGGPATMETTHL